MDKIVFYADGGSRGNPGIAGSGTIVYGADGQTVVKEIVYVVGKKATNNVAEYHGLLRGLEAARELGAREVEAHMDSKLVVEQINGRWKIKHPDMQKLALEARRIIADFGSFTLDWVPRAKNKEADRLSNDAMDAAAAGHAPGIVGGDTAPLDNGSTDITPVPESQSSSSEHTSIGSSQETHPGDWMGDRGAVTRFLLLRHGQTQMSVDKLYSGHTDAPLTALGKKQAIAAAQALEHRCGGDIDVIVSSPLERCQQTAAAAAQALGIDNVEVIDGLIELNFGAWEGLTFAQAHERDPELHAQWLTDPATACPEGESLQQLHRRVRGVRKQLQERYAGKTVLVVSHVNPIKSFIRQALDAGPVIFNTLFLSIASLSEVEFWQQGSLARCVNDVGHLAALD
ncbi:MAG: bifunctional RNase H/acid phosphatase [Corynebacterium sp.]|nr:bifunctional RNase H/acid phosphatase [Corynebacterium sp.]